MRLSWIILCICVAISTDQAQAGTNPCSRKFLKSSDMGIGTSEFNMYLELLLEERILMEKDLGSFLKALEKGKLSNPIPVDITNKGFDFHRREFDKLIATGNVDLKMVQSFLSSYLKKAETVQEQKAKTSKKVEGVFFITSVGATFFKTRDQKLGEVYKILKPGKKLEDGDGFDDVRWAVKPLKGKFKHEQGQAEEACKKAGGRLPTNEDYERLRGYFEMYDRKDNFISKYGLKEFAQVFTPVEQNKYWASPANAKDITLAPRSSWMYGGSTGMIMFIEGNYELLVRCVTKASR